MLARLAVGNLRRSVRDYSVYFVTLLIGIAVFYAFNTIAVQADFLDPSVSEALGTIGRVLSALTLFLAVVMGLLMVYANGFLMRRRSRELGLYQVLGMRRRQVAGIVAIELIMASVVSVILGFVAGALLSQVLVFVTAQLFHKGVTGFRFFVSADAVALTLVCFAIIFLVMLALNVLQVGRLSLTDLMGAGRRNESVRVRGPLPSTLLFAVGLALVLLSYARLLRDGLPFMAGSRVGFAVTTVLVMVGTVCLCFGLGGIYLVISQHRARRYWRDLNMFTMRQVASRVNTMCASLSVIALTLFLAMTSVTSGMGICEALTDRAEEHCPYDASITVVTSGIREDAVELMAEAGLDMGPLGSYALTSTYSGLGDEGELSLSRIVSETGLDMPWGLENSDADLVGMTVMGASDLNATRALLGLDPIDLESDGYLITCSIGESITGFYEGAMGRGYSFELAGHALRPTQGTCITDASAELRDESVGINQGTLIVPDHVLEAALSEGGAVPRHSYLNVMYPAGSDAQGQDRLVSQACDTLATALDERGSGGAVLYSTRTSVLQESFGTRGLIGYLAVYIGFVLVVSCAAILAIKQLTSTSDSAPYYRTLSQLGCPERLCYRSLCMQTLVVFLVPLVLALMHSMVAVHEVMELVEVLGVVGMGPGVAVTAIIFLAVYGVYLLVTYQTSRGIVRSGMLGTGRPHSR